MSPNPAEDSREEGSAEEDDEAALQQRIDRLLIPLSLRVKESQSLEEDDEVWEPDEIRANWTCPIPFDTPSCGIGICNDIAVVPWVFPKLLKRYKDTAELDRDEDSGRAAVVLSEIRAWDNLQLRRRGENPFVWGRDGEPWNRGYISKVERLLREELAGRCRIGAEELFASVPHFLLHSITISKHNWYPERTGRRRIEAEEEKGYRKLALLQMKLETTLLEGGHGGETLRSLTAAEPKLRSPSPPPPVNVSISFDDYLHPVWDAVLFHPSNVDSGRAYTTILNSYHQGALVRKYRLGAMLAALLAGVLGEAVSTLISYDTSWRKRVRGPRLWSTSVELDATQQYLLELHIEFLKDHRHTGLLHTMPRTVLQDILMDAVGRYVRSRQGLPELTVGEGNQDPVVECFHPAARETFLQMWGQATGWAKNEYTVGHAAEAAEMVSLEVERVDHPVWGVRWPVSAEEVSLCHRPAPFMWEGAMLPLQLVWVADTRERSGIEDIALRPLAAIHGGADADEGLLVQSFFNDVLVAFSHAHNNLRGSSLRDSLAILMHSASWLRIIKKGGKRAEFFRFFFESPMLSEAGLVARIEMLQESFGVAGDPPETLEETVVAVLRADQAPLTCFTGAMHFAASYPNMLECLLTISRLGAQFRGVATLAGQLLGAYTGLEETDTLFSKLITFRGISFHTVPFKRAQWATTASVNRFKLRALCHCCRLHDGVLCIPRTEVEAGSDKGEESDEGEEDRRSDANASCE